MALGTTDKTKQRWCSVGLFGLIQYFMRSSRTTSMSLSCFIELFLTHYLSYAQTKGSPEFELVYSKLPTNEFTSEGVRKAYDTFITDCPGVVKFWDITNQSMFPQICSHLKLNTTVKYSVEDFGFHLVYSKFFYHVTLRMKQIKAVGLMIDPKTVVHDIYEYLLALYFAPFLTTKNPEPQSPKTPSTDKPSNSVGKPAVLTALTSASTRNQDKTPMLTPSEAPVHVTTKKVAEEIEKINQVEEPEDDHELKDEPEVEEPEDEPESSKEPNLQIPTKTNRTPRNPIPIDSRILIAPEPQWTTKDTLVYETPDSSGSDSSSDSYLF